MTDTRNRIIAATNELFRRRGYHGTALKDVTSAAAATTGSLYHFFPGGKSQLAAAVISESGAAYEQLFEAIADEAMGPARAIADFFDGAADVLEQTDFIDVCPIGTVAREVASTDEELRQASQQVYDSWVRAAGARLSGAGLSNDTAHSLAVTVVASLEGGFVLARTKRDADVLREVGRRMSALISSCLRDLGSPVTHSVGKSGGSLPAARPSP